MNAFSNVQRNQFAKALSGNHFELTDTGEILLPTHRLLLGGVFTCDVNGKDRIVAPNLLPTQGLVDILKVYFQGGAQSAALYIAPFSGNVAPTASLTAANFASTQTELTAYSQATRVPWTPPGSAIIAASIDNAASPAQFSINANSQTVWGFGVLSASAKSATTGVLVAAAQFSTAKSVNSGDSLNTTYTFTASST